jgi:hypothetical protein
MAKSTFRYVPFPITANAVHPQGTTAYRPVAIATIKASNGNSVRWIVMPDSGADDCLFPLSLAIMLKLDVLQLPKAMTGGVGSQMNPTYYDNVTIDMGNGIVFSAHAGFTQGMDSVGMGLLGQSGFFESFAVEFRHCDKIFTVEKP